MLCSKRKAFSFVVESSRSLLYYEARQKITRSDSRGLEAEHSGVVGGSGDSDITSLGDVLDSHCRPSLTGHSDPCGSAAASTADFKEVVGGPAGSLPGFAGIGADLELGGTALGVDNLSREPVLGDTGFHVNGKRSGDGASNVIPAHVNDPGAFRSQVREGVLIEIEVVGTTSGTLIGNHCGNGLAVWASHRHLMRSNN